MGQDVCYPSTSYLFNWLWSHLPILIPVQIIPGTPSGNCEVGLCASFTSFQRPKDVRDIKAPMSFHNPIIVVIGLFYVFQRPKSSFRDTKYLCKDVHFVFDLCLLLLFWHLIYFWSQLKIGIKQNRSNFCGNTTTSHHQKPECMSMKHNQHPHPLQRMLIEITYDVCASLLC